MRHRKVGRILIRYMPSLSDTLILPWFVAVVIVQGPYGSLQQRLTHTPEASGCLRDQMPSQRCALVMKDGKANRVADTGSAITSKTGDSLHE